ncbi:unnamed protein product, partial [Vitrella brassicaformis CCMP3155]
EPIPYPLPLRTEDSRNLMEHVELRDDNLQLSRKLREKQREIQALKDQIDSCDDLSGYYATSQSQLKQQIRENERLRQYATDINDKYNRCLEEKHGAEKRLVDAEEQIKELKANHPDTLASELDALSPKAPVEAIQAILHRIDDSAQKTARVYETLRVRATDMLVGRVRELESDVERVRGVNEKLVEEVREARGESSRLAEDKSRLQSEVARREAIIDGLQSCVGCRERQPTQLIRPCKHLAFCDTCFGQWNIPLVDCPMCKQHIDSIERVFVG